MSVKELVKDRGYEIYPQDSSIIVKMELVIDDKNQVVCNVQYHQLVDKLTSSQVQSTLYEMLTREEIEHLKQQVQRLQIISKE